MKAFDSTFKNLSVTVVDVLGIFLPGLLLLLGLMALVATDDVPDHWRDTTALMVRLTGGSASVQVSLAAALAYVLGFLLRLTSVAALERLTAFRWRKRLKSLARIVEPLLKRELDDDIAGALVTMAENPYSKAVGAAPYFHFAKRVVRRHAPALWVEVERIEAELRFAAGLFVPLLVILVVASRLPAATTLQAALFTVAGVGLGCILWVFPSKRIREVLYVYFLALICLRARIGVRPGPRPPNQNEGHPTEQWDAL